MYDKTSSRRKPRACFNKRTGHLAVPCPLVKHTAQHPNSHPSLQVSALHKLGRIGCGSLPLVEMAVIETASENLSIPLSTGVVFLLNFPDTDAEKQA